MNKILAVLTSMVMLVSGIFFGTGVENIDPGEHDQVKNVILFIGDGMGENHLKLAKQMLDIELAMDTFPYKGQSKTRSMTGITDSAAGATALSCGVRTENSYIGVYWLDPLMTYSVPTNITELANAHGMKTGVVTTDTVTGATPSGFTVHTRSRDNKEDIMKQQLNSYVDLLWGGCDQHFNKATAEANGFTVVENKDEMNALENGTKTFGQFSGEMWNITSGTDAPTLSQMTEKAISLLDNDNGFFLMVEGAHIDKHADDNDADKTVLAVQELDKAVAIALDFAKKDGNTMVVVTADHETGGLIEKDDGTFKFTTKQHTLKNVPLLVYGSNSFIANGEAISNIMVPRTIAASLGFENSEFTNAMGMRPRAMVENKKYALAA